MPQYDQAVFVHHSDIGHSVHRSDEELRGHGHDVINADTIMSNPALSEVEDR